jgi:Zn-dependent protease
MHDDQPSEPDGRFQPPAPPPYPPPSHMPPPSQNRSRRAGGIVVGLAVLAAKFKTILAILFSVKWLFLVTKFGISFGSIFVSVWFYALAFGWKLGIVFVLLIVVHEMGHWVVLRGFGVDVSLPYLIPGLGAFVAQKSMTANAVQDAAAALAGPAIGIAASGMCQAYGLATHENFWIGAAYIGYPLNLFNLIPALPFDGGRVAGTIDGRLWMLGIVAFIAYIVTTGLDRPIAWLFLLLVVATTFKKAIAAWRGYVDPRVAAIPGGTRGIIALAYFGTIVLAAAGAAASHPPMSAAP